MNTQDFKPIKKATGIISKQAATWMQTGYKLKRTKHPKITILLLLV